MSERSANRELLTGLSERGLLDHGVFIPSEVVQSILGIKVPEFGTKRDFDRLALAELSAIDYVRNLLLGDGKYLSGTAGGYRILLPSENEAQIQSYMQQADKKLSRALKLSRSTPASARHNNDQTEARILLKQEARRSHPRRATATQTT